MRPIEVNRCAAWLLVLLVGTSIGCAREDADSGTFNARGRVEAAGSPNANAMPPLPQPQAPKLVTSAADAAETGDTVLRFVRGVAGSYFYAASEGDRERIVSSNPDVRFEKALFQVSPPGVDGVPVYRFQRSDGSGDFLTSSPQERDAISASRAHSFFHYDGIAFNAVRHDRPGALPVYRLSSNLNGAYLYTADHAERAAAIRSGDWLEEGVAFHALPAGRRILSGTESAERQRLEQLEARLTQRLEQRGTAR